MRALRACPTLLLLACLPLLATSDDSAAGLPPLSAALSRPVALAADRGGSVFIVSEGAHCVWVLDADDDTLKLFAGADASGADGDGGSATSSRLLDPRGVAVDAKRNVLIADAGSHRLRVVAAITGVMRTLAGTGAPGAHGDGGAASRAALHGPVAVAVESSSGRIAIADQLNHKVRLISAEGIISTLAGTGAEGAEGDGGPASAAALSLPSSVAFDRVGNVLIADHGNSRVRIVSAFAGTITTLAGTGDLGYSGDGGLASAAVLLNPLALSVDPGSGDTIIVDGLNNVLRRVSAASGLITTIAGSAARARYEAADEGAPALEAGLFLPSGVAFDAEGRILVADTHNHRVRRVDAAGRMDTIAGSGLAEHRVSMDPQTLMAALGGRAPPTRKPAQRGDNETDEVRIQALPPM